jgi:hypothetical protein
MSNNTGSLEELITALINVMGRVAVPQARLREIVAPQGTVKNAKQIAAYNLCNGTKTQAEVRKIVGIDVGNFSRTVGRWEQKGVLFRLGKDKLLLHLYPLEDEEDE